MQVERRINHIQSTLDATGILQGKILILFPHMVVPGGALNYVLKLAEFLVQKGASVGIVTMQHDALAISTPNGVEVLSVDGPLTSSMSYWCLFPLWQRKINRIIGKWQPDLLVPQVFPSNWWGWLHRRRHDVPLLWVCHEPSAFIHSDAWIRALKPWWKGMLARILRPMLSYVDRLLAGHSDTIVTNSRFTAREVNRVYGINVAAVAYPPVDSSFFTPGGLEREEAVITVAALSQFKRVDFLLRVFARVVQSHPHLLFHVVGKGDEEARLKALADSLHITDNVVFHGTVGPHKLRDLYRRSLLFLHGGMNEPFGMAPLEAIACGTPAVAHNSGGPAEYITDSCGRLIDSVDEKEWADSIGTFLELFRNSPPFFASVAECAKPFAAPSTFEPLITCLASLLSDSPAHRDAEREMVSHG